MVLGRPTRLFYIYRVELKTDRPCKREINETNYVLRLQVDLL